MSIVYSDDSTVSGDSTDTDSDFVREYTPDETRLRQRLALEHSHGRGFRVCMPDGVSLAFGSSMAAVCAHQCYFLRGPAASAAHLAPMKTRPDLAAQFAKDGKLGGAAGARTLHRQWKRLLRREGEALNTFAWAYMRMSVMSLVLQAHAAGDADFARVRLRLTARPVLYRAVRQHCGQDCASVSAS